MQDFDLQMEFSQMLNMWLDEKRSQFTSGRTNSHPAGRGSVQPTQRFVGYPVHS